MDLTSAAFQAPEMWLTYSDLEHPLRAMLLEPDTDTRHGPRLEAFIECACALEVHGAVAVTATTVAAIAMMADEMIHGSAVDGVSVVSGMRVWTGDHTKLLDAILACWAKGSHVQANSLMAAYVRHEGLDGYIAALTDRLLFATYLTEVLSPHPVGECTSAFLDGFFSQAR